MHVSLSALCVTDCSIIIMVKMRLDSQLVPSYQLTQLYSNMYIAFVLQDIVFTLQFAWLPHNVYHLSERHYSTHYIRNDPDLILNPAAWDAISKRLQNLVRQV